jgi:hypothetical protein
MTGPTEDTPAELVVETSSLFERSGFDGGNLLLGLFPDLGAADLRELLTDVVRHLVVPQLDQKVSLLSIPTVHNPIRVTSVDNVSVSWTSERGTGPRITPDQVTVQVADIMAVARKRKLAPSSNGV